MNTSTRTDIALLRQYADQNSQEAFAALVSRHLNLVYTTCLRELGDSSLAEDAAQSVFIILASKARRLSPRTNLAGWLFQTARFAAKNARTRQTRRERHEREAVQRSLLARAEHEKATWDDALPLLDTAVAKLSAGDREAILLRYWDDLRIAEVGASLGMSEEAARKRINRALERLRAQLEHQGVALGIAALAVSLRAGAIHPAPHALAGSVARLTAHTTAAGLVNLGLASPAAQQVTKGMLRAMKVAQLKTIGALAAAGVIAGGVAVKIVFGNAVPDPKVDLSKPVSGQGDVVRYLPAPAPVDAHRNVIITGRLVYGNDQPAAGIHVAAEAQSEPFEQLKTSWTNELMGNTAVTRADGSYSIPVGSGLPYNILAFDSSGKWIAAAVKGVKGRKGATVSARTMVFTQGSMIEGIETNSKGQPITANTLVKLGSGQMAKGSQVAVIDAARPGSSGGVDDVPVDSSGYYRIRVTPGVCRVYVMDNASLQSKPGSDKTVTVAPGEIKIVNLQVP